jgi:hypothetical protein
MTMTLNECHEILSKISYKPGWQFAVIEMFGRPFMMIAQPVLHRDTKEPITVNHQLPLWSLESFTETRLLECVRLSIHGMETHEADEMFLYGGQRIFDPHAKGNL